MTEVLNPAEDEALSVDPPAVPEADVEGGHPIPPEAAEPIELEPGDEPGEIVEPEAEETLSPAEIKTAIDALPPARTCELTARVVALEAQLTELEEKLAVLQKAADAHWGVNLK